MKTTPKEKRQVSNLTVAMVLAWVGLVCFLASVFSFYREVGWVEKQRSHPDVNPVVYAGVLELLHYAWGFLVVLGAIFPLIVFYIWRYRREEQKRDKQKDAA